MLTDGIIKIPIEPNYAGDYRVAYDGKYVSLYGKDRDFIGFNFVDNGDVWFEEMVLVPVVAEVRQANPFIQEVTETHVVINLNIQHT